MIKITLYSFLAICLSGTQAFAQSGFHGTVNHYGVAMNCREPGCSISQWIKTDFQVFDDGTVQAPITLENDTLNGFCGSIRMEIHGAGNALLATAISPTYCIGPKSFFGGGPNRATVAWSFNVSAAAAQSGCCLLGVPASYEQRFLNIDPGSIDWGQVIAVGTTIVESLI